MIILNKYKIIFEANKFINNDITYNNLNIIPLSLPFKHKLFKNVKFNINNLLYFKSIKYESPFVVVIILLFSNVNYYKQYYH